MFGKIITSEVPVEAIRLATAELIQVSDRKLKGFHEIVEGEIPEYNEETHYLTYEYQIIDNVIHKVYSVKEKTQEELLEEI